MGKGRKGRKEGRKDRGEKERKNLWTLYHRQYRYNYKPANITLLPEQQKNQIGEQCVSYSLSLVLARPLSVNTCKEQHTN